MNRYVTSRLAGERDRIRNESEADQRYREAFDTESDLEWMMTPQVDLAAERARDRITPSQPSREVQRQAGEYPCEVSLPGMRTVVWAALLSGTMALLIWGVVL